MRNKTVSVRLDSKTLERLGAIAKAMDRPRAWLMAHAIPARYVEEQSWQVVAIQKAMKRLQNGEAKFADHKQVGEWLENCGRISPRTAHKHQPKWPTHPTSCCIIV